MENHELLSPVQATFQLYIFIYGWNDNDNNNDDMTRIILNVYKHPTIIGKT